MYVGVQPSALLLLKKNIRKPIYNRVTNNNQPINYWSTKKIFFLLPKMFKLFLDNFGALISKMQSVFLYQV